MTVYHFTRKCLCENNYVAIAKINKYIQNLFFFLELYSNKIYFLNLKIT